MKNQQKGKKRNNIKKEHKKDIDAHISLNEQKIQNYDGYWINYLSEIGVPLAPDGTPLGIGWD